MKQKAWILRYDTEIKVKKTTYTQQISATQIKELKKLLKNLVPPQTEEGLGFEESNYNLLGFIALSCSCHPRHEDLLANLGYANVNADISEASLDNAAYVSKQIVHRKATSNGSAVIVTHYFEVLDETFKPLSKMTMKLMEKRMAFDNNVDEDAAPQHSRRDKTEIRLLMQDNILLEEQNILSPDMETHMSFCKLLGLDAPLHHADTKNITDHPPTVPSTLHLCCHQIEANYHKEVGDSESCHYSDVTFYSQMKPSKIYKRSKYELSLPKRQQDSNKVSKPYLSVIEDEEGNLMSSVFFERE